jgi:hypothetical protein
VQTNVKNAVTISASNVIAVASTLMNAADVWIVVDPVITVIVMAVITAVLLSLA